MPVDMYYFKSNKKKSTRRYFPNFTKYGDNKYNLIISNFFTGKKEYTFDKNNFLGNYANKINDPIGFNLICSNINNSQTEVRAIFHDATLSNMDHKPMFDYQLIDIPKIDKINAILYFTETFFEKERKIKLYFYNYNIVLEAEKGYSIKKDSEININDIEDINLKFIKFIIVEILNDNFNNLKTHQYVNVYYTINNKICDNVHAHCLEDQRVLPKKQINIKKGIQALKWMNFPRQDMFETFVSIINVNYKLNFKLRIIFSDSTEYILSSLDLDSFVDLGKIEINLTQIFKTKKFPLDKNGIIQLECKNANPNANLFNYNARRQTLSVDHFTGG